PRPKSTRKNAGRPVGTPGYVCLANLGPPPPPASWEEGTGRGAAALRSAAGHAGAAVDLGIARGVVGRNGSRKAAVDAGQQIGVLDLERPRWVKLVETVVADDCNDVRIKSRIDEVRCRRVVGRKASARSAVQPGQPFLECRHTCAGG